MNLNFTYRAVVKRTTADGKETSDKIKGTFNTDQQEVHISEDLGVGEVRSMTARTTYEMEPDEKIFLNGYQTWTYCTEYGVSDRMRGVNNVPQRLLDTYHFDRYGDYHFVEYSERAGMMHGFSWCYFRKGDRFRLIASLNERPGYTIFRYDANVGKLTIKRDCDELFVDGEYAMFDLYFAEGTEQEVFDGWFAAMRMKPRTEEKLYGYSSWYNRYQNITEQAILLDLEGCKRIFKEGDLFQVDDGWEPFVGDWLEQDQKKFPGGMKKIADEIHAAGFKAGLWLAPFVAQEDSQLVKEHPDWLLLVDGERWTNGCNWGNFYSLDIDNPEVVDYVRQTFQRVYDEWGFDLVKLDFLYAVAPYGTHYETRGGRMTRALELLRACAGDNHQILGCGTPVMPAFGLVDYCRVSCDVSLDWDDRLYMRGFHRERTSTRQAIGTTMFRRQLNGRAYLSDPDVFFLRSENIRLTERQKADLAHVCALSGGVFLTSDDPSSYTDEMVRQYKELRELAEKAELTGISALTGTGFVLHYVMDGEEKEYIVNWTANLLRTTDLIQSRPVTNAVKNLRATRRERIAEALKKRRKK